MSTVLTTPEFYAYANTTVASGGYTSGSGVLNVASTGAPFSQTQQFRINIVDQTTGVVKAILKVTTLNSATQWVVTSDGLDASAVIGDLVQLALTASAMDQMRADMLQSVSSSLPTIAKKGDTIYTDDGMEMMYNGSLYVPIRPYLPGLSNPRLTSFAWRNQGSHTVVQGMASEFLSRASGTTNSMGGREISGLTAPYTIRALFLPSHVLTGGGAVGLYICDGTKLVRFQLDTEQNVGFHKFNSVTSYNSTYSSTAYRYVNHAPIMIGITNDGTNITCSVYPDGVNPWIFSVQGKSDWVSTQAIAGWFVDTSNGSEVIGAKLLSWKVS